MLVGFKQIHNIADPLIDLVLIRAWRKVILVKDARKLRHPKGLLIGVPVVVDIGLHARHIRLEDVDGCEVPALGKLLLVELLEP